MARGLSVSRFNLFSLGLLVTSCALVFPGVSRSAPPAESKKDMKPPLVQPRVSDTSASTTGPNLNGKKLPKPASDKAVEGTAKKPSSSARGTKKSSRNQKSQKSKVQAKPPMPAEPQPDIATNLAHYGILQRPRRYDPGYDRRAGSVLHPMGRELLYDHFLELDRNHDGAIDPFERAGGRLDIDRDLRARE